MSRCRHRIAAPTATALRAGVGWRSEAATGSDLSGRGTAVARSDPMAPRSGFGLHRFAVATAGATLVLLFLGGLVTSTGSGLAVVPGPAWSAPRPRRSPTGLGVLAGLTTGAVFGQVVLGALVRHMHAGLAIPDFPLAFGRLVPPLVTPHIAVHFAHRVGALVV